MSYGVVFALLCLFLTGCNDVLFKRYSIGGHSRGMLIFGVGLIWTLAQWSLALIQETPIEFNNATLIFGLMAGVFVTISNLLLLESLRHIKVSLGATIYRLNTIGVILLSFVFLNEPFGWFKGFGILIGLIAVLFLYQGEISSSNQKQLLLFVGVAAVASFFRAAFGVSTKAGFLEGADRNSMLLIISSNWILGGAVYALWRERRFRITWEKTRFICLSSFLVVGVTNFLMLALQHGEASTVIPIANMSFVIALLLSVALKMETFTTSKIWAMVLAAGSILCLAKL
ncbi:MAG: DMT family transporter [SAR324 cluster bacterium]|nr:DMT family transporter [SAR324 cluster bacterium]